MAEHNPADFREFDPETLTLAERYKLLIGCVVPRPIAFVSTVSPDGAPNLAPFSFYNAVGSNPMLVLFCPANTPEGGEKDSLRNAKPEAEGGTGEFVISVAAEPYERQVAGAGEALPFGESEFDLVGLERSPSKTVRPPRVAIAPAGFECRTEQIIRTNPGEPGGGNIVIGRVLHAWVRADLINERMHVDQAGLGAIGRMGGLSYCRTGDRFELPVGRKALGQGEKG